MSKQKIKKPKKISYRNMDLRKWITLLTAVLIITASIAGIYTYIVEQNSISGITKNSRSNSKRTTKFYYFEQNSKVVSYELYSGKKTTVQLPDGFDRGINYGSLGSNQSVQISKDGKSIFYISTVYDPATGGGEGASELDKTRISVYKNGKETKLTERQLSNNTQIADWVINPDGSEVYYLMAPSSKANNAKLSLRKIDVSTKKDILIQQDIAEQGTNTNPLYVASDNSLVLITGDIGYKLNVHRIVNGKYSLTNLGTPCQCMFQSPQAISPDGTKIIGSESADETGGTTTAYIINLSTGSAKKVNTPQKGDYWRWAVWSPDSRLAVHENSVLGSGPTKGISLVNTNNKKSISLIDPNRNVLVVGWSDDGRFIAFSEGDKIKFYDLANEKEVGVSLTSSDASTGNVTYGWL